MFRVWVLGEFRGPEKKGLWDSYQGLGSWYALDPKKTHTPLDIPHP